MARAIDAPPRSQTKHRKSTWQLQYEAQKTRTRSTHRKSRLQHHSEELPRDAKRRKHANDPTFKLSLKTQTRITTRYSIKPVASRRTPRDTAGDAETAGPSKPPRGSLVITTYDPVSGVNLKYRTTKAAEVTRLMHSALGRLGRCMAGLPAEAPEEAMPDAPVPVSAVEGADGDKQGNGGVATPVQQGQQAQPGGGKKKKKKGRK